MSPEDPADRGRRTVVAGVGVAAFVTAITLPGAAVASTALQDPAELERLYAAGQDRYAARDYVGAAEAWTELLHMLPENEANRATRENVLLNILQAHLDAYRRLRDEDGNRMTEQLHAAERLFDEYVQQFRASYGDAVPLAAVVQERADEIHAELAEAQVGACLGPMWCLTTIGPCLSPPPPPPTRRGCGGKHDDVALLGVLALPGLVRRRRRDVLAGLSSRLPADVVERLQTKLETDPED
jgi:hypothetical protein